MSVSKFGPTGPAFEQVIKPNRTPLRVFYRTRRKSSIFRKIGVFTMNKMKKMRLAALAAVTSATAVASSAYAAVATDVTTAIDTAGDDAVTVGSAVLVVIVTIFAIKVVRRAL